MIPKVIHYVWVGGNPLTPLAEKCIESWKKFCPDYEIKRWDESNFDINQNQFCREAYQCKKWAFVSDYIRLKVLFEEGGIYMDTDVEVVKPIDEFLKHKGFSGFESSLKIPTGIMSAEKGNEWIKLMLDYYDNRPFIKEDGTYENLPNVLYMTDITVEKYNMPLDNNFHDIGDYVFYPNDYFCPTPDSLGCGYKTTKNTYTIHHFAGSWTPKEYKKEQKRNMTIKKFIAFFIGKKNLEKLLKKRRDKKEQNNKNVLYEKLKKEQIDDKQ